MIFVSGDYTLAVGHRKNNNPWEVVASLVCISFLQSL